MLHQSHGLQPCDTGELKSGFSRQNACDKSIDHSANLSNTSVIAASQSLSREEIELKTAFESLRCDFREQLDELSILRKIYDLCEE